MKSNNRRLIQLFCKFCLLFMPVIAPQHIYSADNPMQTYFQTLAMLNRAAPAESAAAHGLHGWRIGVGLSSTSIKNQLAGEILESEANHQSFDKDQQVNLPKIWLTKGLLYPIDIGFIFSSSLKNQIQQSGGYMQWTVFEALATPALALRMAHSRLFGLKSSKISSSSIGLTTSWGFRAITLFLGFNYNLHQANAKTELKESCMGDFTASFQSQKCSLFDQANTKNTWTESTSHFGLQINILPPLVNLSLESIASDLAASTHQIKLSVGL